LGNLGIEERIILKWKYGERVWTGLNWLRIRSCGKLL
jgi:hypothetical protein